MVATCGARLHGFGMMEDELDSGHVLYSSRVPACYTVSVYAHYHLQRTSVRLEMAV